MVENEVEVRGRVGVRGEIERGGVRERSRND